ncbi:MAG TPA: hypothetical protein GX392_05480 [Clostridiales bacterium]|nr:hypothetical protein [Clostridiales bacterium]
MKYWFKHIKIIKNNYELYASEASYKKTFTAYIIDTIFIYVVVFFTMFLLGLTSGVNIIIAALFSILALVPINILLYQRFKKNYNKLKGHVFEKIRKEEIEKKLISLSHRNFPVLLIELLIENRIVSNIVIQKDFIEGTKDSVRYAIGYDILEPGEKTSLDTIESFIYKMKNLGFENIIFFSTNEFQDECHKLKEFFQNRYIFLVDKEHIIKMTLDTYMGLEDVEVENIIKKKYRQREKIYNFKKNSVISNKNAKSFFSYSAIFFILTFIIKNSSIYYMGISISFFILGLFTYLINKYKASKDNIINTTKGVDNK